MPEVAQTEQQAARAELDRLWHDAGEMKARAGHRTDPVAQAARGRLQAALRAANPGEARIGREINEPEEATGSDVSALTGSALTGPGERKSAATLCAEALDRECGPGWRDKLPAVRAFLAEAVGPEAFEEIEKAAGNSPVFLSELMGLAADRDAALVAGAIREFLSAGVYGARAETALMQLEAEAPYHDWHHVGHRAALVRGKALLILKDPALLRALSG